MIVLLEGVDGSGKTTLCEQLKDIGYTILDNKGEDEFDEYLSYKNAQRSDKVFVCDRSFITDLVYRTVDLQPPRGISLNRMIELLSWRCCIIYCRSGTEFIDSIVRGEDNVTSLELSEQIIKTYDVLLDMLKVFANAKVKYYNWHEHSVDDVIKFIERR